MMMLSMIKVKLDLHSVFHSYKNLNKEYLIPGIPGLPHVFFSLMVTKNVIMCYVH